MGTLSTGEYNKDEFKAGGGGSSLVQFEAMLKSGKDGPADITLSENWASTRVWCLPLLPWPPSSAAASSPFAMNNLPGTAPIFPAGKGPLPPGISEEDREGFLQAKKYESWMMMGMESCVAKTVIAGAGGTSLYLSHTHGRRWNEMFQALSPV